MEKRKFAFTLAEVLITLGIIGVVAAMTIPTLISNFQKRAWETILKEDYALVSEGLLRLMADDQVDYFDHTDYYKTAFNGSSQEQEANELRHLSKYFKNFESVGFNSFYTMGVGDDVSGTKRGEPCEKWVGTGVGWYILHDSQSPPRCTILRQSVFKLANGSYFKFNPTSYPTISTNDTKLTSVVGEITLDVNGAAEPNTYGRDAFIFVLGNNGKLYPRGGYDHAKYLEITKGQAFDGYYWKTATGNAFNCDTSKVSAGYGCAARVMENNWKIDY